MFHLRRACFVGVVVLAATCPVFAPPDNRSYVASKPFLTLGGVKCGILKSVEGGGITAEVIQESASAGAIVKKRLGPPLYEDFTFDVSPSQDKALFDWIAQSWKMNPQRKDGSVVSLNFDMTPKSERQFVQAFVRETTIPALDGVKKEPGYLTVKISPREIREVAPTGQKSDYAAAGQNAPKAFICCNFTVAIDGIDCTQVTRVDSFTVRQGAVPGATGAGRDAFQTPNAPGRIEFPNLKLLVREAGAQSFIDWHKSFVIEGKNDDTKERGGMITLLSPTGQTALLRIQLFNVGIVKAQPARVDTTSEEVGMYEVELYVERMELLAGEDTANTPPAGTTPATGITPMRRRG